MFGKHQYFIDLLIGMTEKELSVRYKQTLFGFLWVIINPLLQMIVIGFIFRFFIKETIENYNLFLLTGLLIWNFFTLSLTKATPSVVYERNLIKKAKFPREVIPLSIILSNFIHLLVSFAILLFVLGAFKLLTLYGLFLTIAVLIWLLLLTTGISLLTTALNVRFRDISFFVQAVLIVWFYATPIIYAFSFIPLQLQWIWYLNPLTAIVVIGQAAFFGTEMPTFFGLIINICLTLFLLTVGVYYFAYSSKNFDDWV